MVRTSSAVASPARRLASPPSSVTSLFFPILPIYHYATVFMMDETIKGYPLENAQDNWYAKDLYRVAGE